MTLTKNAAVENVQSELNFLKNESIESVESLLEIIKSTLESGEDVLFVKTWRKFEYGTPIILKFPLFSFDKIIQVSGKVIRNDPNGFAVSFDKPIKGLICKKGHLPEIVHESDRQLSN